MVTDFFMLVYWEREKVSSEQLAVGVAWGQRRQTSDDQTSDACLAFVAHLVAFRFPWTVDRKGLEKA